ncbi:hypothetical protein [Psychromonas sp. GE-S-Ul-11]|uniref:hypothetical protein n=1 Tax=Psychromonas sp. GE-S-Ul-11 TaxID=3241170 RepID=UPI003AAF7CDE
MASSSHIKALLTSHIDQDNDRFLSIALQVAAHEARSGHSKIAQELRDIVEDAKENLSTIYLYLLLMVLKTLQVYLLSATLS